MSLVYVFAASGMEGQPVRRIGIPSGSKSSLRCGSHDVFLITGAMGPKNARNKAEAALSASACAGRKPDLVLIIGLCGGLTASLPEGTVVVYTECRSTEAAKPLFRCSDAIVDQVTELLKSSSLLWDRVVGITSPRIATTTEQRLALSMFGASVVDMESYSVLETAAALGIRGAVVRVVSDSVDRKLPDFNRALNDDGGLDGRKALRVALGSPLRTARLLAANKRAIRHLEKALEIVLKSPCLA